MLAVSADTFSEEMVYSEATLIGSSVLFYNPPV